MASTTQRLHDQGLPVTTINANFAAARRELTDRGVRADLLLADLGTNSAQLDDPLSGFSFMSDGPLDMRFDQSSGPTAADLVATLSEAELAGLIHRYGEEPLAGRIARRAVAGHAGAGSREDYRDRARARQVDEDGTLLRHLAGQGELHLDLVGPGRERGDFQEADAV